MGRVAPTFLLALAVLAAAANPACGHEVRSDDPGPGAELIGVWESIARSKGGIGMTLEFGVDGSVVQSPGAMVDYRYHVEGDRVVIDSSVELPLRFRYRDGDLSMVAPPGVGEVPDVPMERIGAAPSGEPGPAGRWRSRPSPQPTPPELQGFADAMATMQKESFYVFTLDGRLLLRIPFVHQPGRYAVAGGLLTLDFGNGARATPFRIEEDALVLGEATGEQRYRRADY
jgi:hypothetical protein